MRKQLRTTIFGLAILLSANAIADTAADILQQMSDRKRASLAGIENYSLVKSTMGMCSLEYFEKESTELPDEGGTVEYMRLVPMAEVMERNSPDSAINNLTPKQLDEIANDMRAEGKNLDLTVKRELQTAGLPAGLGSMLANPPSDKPWLSPMPGDMMGNYATMLEGAAEGKRQQASQRAEAEREAKADPLARIAKLTRIVGRETFNKRPAIHMVAENLNFKQLENEQEFVLNTLHFWVDAEEYVPLKMQMEGVANEGGQLRDLRIEREDSEHRNVDSCESMFEPHRVVTRISGVLNAKEQKEMEEARKQMAEFEAQLASMPKSQQDMIMRQMGPQLETFRKMAAGQGIEMVSSITAMRCNAGPPSNEEYLQLAPGMSQGACASFER